MTAMQEQLFSTATAPPLRTKKAWQARGITSPAGKVTSPDDFFLQIGRSLPLPRESDD
jgi:hypothetical protein